MTRRPLLLRLVDELLSGRGIWPAVPAIVVLVVVAIAALVLVVFGASMIGLVSDFTQEIFAAIAGGPR